MFRKKRTSSTSKTSPASNKKTSTEAEATSPSDPKSLDKALSSPTTGTGTAANTESTTSSAPSLHQTVMADQPVVKARGFFKRAPTVVGIELPNVESDRLREDKEKSKNWKRWGPYLSERQWATVREDYSDDGSW